MTRPGFPVQRVRPHTAAVLKIAARQMLAVVRVPPIEGLMTVDGIEGLELDEGRYIVVPIALWEQTVRKAMMDPAEAVGASEPDELELPPTRQQRRAKLRN